MANSDDALLIKEVINKNQLALNQLYTKYGGAIYGVILRIVKEQTVAEEVLQETFIKVWQQIERYDAEKGRFYTWIYRIAKNLALNALRNSSKLIQTEDLGVYKEEGQKYSNEFSVDIEGALATLSPHHQRALTLVYFEGYTHREANEIMKIPLGTFKSYVRQALKQLREHYGNELLLIGIMVILSCYG